MENNNNDLSAGAALFRVPGWLLFVGLLLWCSTLTGCAQPQKGGAHHAANFKSDFKSRLDVSVDYIRDSRRAMLVVDLSNPRTTYVRLWLVQTSKTDGQHINAARRFYAGMDKRYQETFKIPLPEVGVQETVFVEVFNGAGKLLLKTEPIETKLEGNS